MPETTALRRRFFYWRVPIAYAFVVFGTYLLAIVVGTVREGHLAVSSGVVSPFVFPVLFFFVPPILAAWHTAVGGAVRQGLAIGVVPAAVFPFMVGLGRLLGVGGHPDAPLGGLVVLYAVVGLVGAGFGVYAVRAFQRLVGE